MIYRFRAGIQAMCNLIVLTVFGLLQLLARPTRGALLQPLMLGDVNTTTFLADAKIVYGAIQDQVSTLAAVMNLFDEGSKFGKPINNIGIRGYTFLARVIPNWNLGYRAEYGSAGGNSGSTGVGSAGYQGLVNATVLLAYAYVPVLITGQAENLTKGETRAFMQAKALEAKFDMKDIVRHVNVVVCSAQRGGQLATVSAQAGATFTCSVAGLLPGAIYLRVGMPVDTGAVGGGVNNATGLKITAIDYSTRVVTYAGGAGVPVVGDAVYLSGEAAQTVGTFPLTAECLVSLVADSGAIEAIDPATYPAWKSWVRDVGAIQWSPSLQQEQIQITKNRGGEEVSMLLWPSAQINQYTNVATTNIKFEVTGPGAEAGKKALDLGFSVYDFMGRPCIEDMDLIQDRIYAGAHDTMNKWEALPLSMANDGATEWTRVSGANGIADAFQGLLRWYHNIGIKQRSAWSVYKNYTIPTGFKNTPPTL